MDSFGNDILSEKIRIILDLLSDLNIFLSKKEFGY